MSAASNAAVARSLTSLATYNQIIDIYKTRPLAEVHQSWFATLVRQRDLKRKGL